MKELDISDKTLNRFYKLIGISKSKTVGINEALEVQQ